MVQEFISEKHLNGTLSIFFAGWGMDARPFNDFCDGHECFDIMICYDYTDMSFDYGKIDRYDNIIVTAWSFGVYAADKSLKDCSKIIRATAVNGTPLPANDIYGIPYGIFTGTLKGLSDTSVMKFRKRMCGDIETYGDFMSKAPERSLESLHDELEAVLLDAHDGLPQKGIWAEALIGTKDRIFPPANQERYWKEAMTGCETMEAPHYCPNILKTKVNGQHGNG